MTIRKRLILSFMAMAAITLMLGGVLSYQLYKLSNHSRTTFEITVSAVDTARQAWDRFRNIKDYTNSVQLRLSPLEPTDVAKLFSQRYDNMTQDLVYLETLGLPAEIVTSIANSKNLADKWQRMQLKIITGDDLHSLPSDSHIASVESDLEQAMEQVVGMTIKHANNQQAEVNASVYNSMITALIMLGVVSVLSFVLAVFISTSLTRPITQLYSFMAALSEGQGDLTKRMEGKRHDELGMVAQKFNLFMETLQRMVARTLHSVNGLNMMTEHFQEKTAAIGHNVQRQKNTVAKTTQTAIDLNSFTSSIVEEAQTARNMAQKVSEQAVDSHRIVLQSTESIASLETSITNTSGSINKLAENSTRISQVINVIKEITEQTNLLALNAAIEAARAGEHGRGFAVVADEVRALASKTQDSTRDIQAIIESIHEGVTASEANMILNKEQARKCVEQNVSVRDTLVSMSEAVAEINAMNQRILKAAEQQADSTREVNADMQQLHGIAEQTHENMADIQLESRELQKTAKALTEVVQGFVV